ncbi:MAG TPA: TIR domain-containing protein, partial [Candidatus Dormibacteraeota bacterium]|nr:TIR domain-containing protein [Candidatus Dormibacteraeota bacterium]
CHSSVDGHIAREICDRLEASGVGCWIAPRDPIAGIPYGQQIVGAIAAARVVLLVFSSHANESRAVLGELELASSRGKIILPVRTEDITPSPSLEFYVRPIHWFDAATRPFDDVFPELIADVQRLVAPAQPAAPLPEGQEQPRAATPAQNNLPLQLSSFVGRERTVAEIETLLHANRLVTLVGSGGGGKTRTAINVASRQLAGFSDGVWLVELAPISNGSLVPGAVARVLGVRESPDSPLLDALVEHLKRRSALLVVDNCEHVMDDVRAVVGAILRGCPDVRILTTSRENLNIAGERVFRLPSLGVPPAVERVTRRSALRYGSVVLFLDRALASDGRFRLTDENAEYVAEICRRLDGIPLAIELAAARIKVLSPQQLAQRLDERFRVLTGGDRSALPRHQTMRALIDWSYDLLPEQERALFRKVSIFADGFTLEGAAAVCGDEGCDEIAVLDLLTSLVDKSLVQADPGAEERYRLLESTRQYAREKLEESGEFEQCARRHLAYLSELFRKSGEKYEATMSGAAVDVLVPELEDARSALDWAERNAITEAVDFFLATSLWAQLGLNREAIALAQRLVELLGEGDNARLARLWERIAICSANIGHGTMALEAVERAVRFARASGDTGVIADCLLRYADVLARVRRFDDAFAAIDEAQSFGPSTLRRDQQALYVRAVTELICGDLDAASASFARSREVFAAAGNDSGIASVSLNLAELDHARG